jgi:hypothetical protein
MPSIRYHVAARDAPSAIAARKLGLTLAEFDAKLPELLRRGFPAADPTTRMFDLTAIDRWQDARHPRLLGGEAVAETTTAKDARLVVPERMREQAERAVAELKAAPMTKRERDALVYCYRANRAFVNVDQFWGRSIGWLSVRGLVETKHEGHKRFARVTPSGEAEWHRISSTI